MNVQVETGIVNTITQKEGNNIEKYYGLFDLQLNGFKGGYAHTNKETLIRMGAERIVELAENDEEPPKIIEGTIQEALDIIESYSYDVIEVSENEYNVILENDDLLFLSETVNI